MCQLAPGFNFTDGHVCAQVPCLLSSRSFCCPRYSSFLSTLPCVRRPVTTSSAPSILYTSTSVSNDHSYLGYLGCLKELFSRIPQTRNISSRTPTTDWLSFPPELGIRTVVFLFGLGVRFSGYNNPFFTLVYILS